MTALPPLPPPGLTLYPGFTARKPETFFIKQRSSWTTKARHDVSFASPDGTPQKPFLKIDENQRGQISFTTTEGQEVMRVVKQRHVWSGRGSEYHGMRGDGNEVWYLKLHRGLLGTDYALTIHPTPGGTAHTLMCQKKVMGQDMGIMLNGQVCATMDNQGAWTHLRRQDVVHVAPGMDILLAVGVNWVRADKEYEDQKAVAAAT